MNQWLQGPIEVNCIFQTAVITKFRFFWKYFLEFVWELQNDRFKFCGLHIRYNPGNPGHHISFKNKSFLEDIPGALLKTVQLWLELITANSIDGTVVHEIATIIFLLVWY